MILEFVLPDAELMLHKIERNKTAKENIKISHFLILFFKRLLSLHMYCTYIHEHACMY